MHLNDNEIGQIQGFLPKYKILLEFLRGNFIFVSNLFKNSKVSMQKLMNASLIEGLSTANQIFLSI